MDKEAQEEPQEGQEQRLVGNGLLQVTVTALFFRKWHVDEVGPSRSRWFFLDGVSLDGIGTSFYVRAWWEIPLDDLSLFEELDKLPLDSFLTMSSSYCTTESAEDFLLTGEESQEQVEGAPEFCLGMKAPTVKDVELKGIEPGLADALSVFVH
jgi:hypothetical protein